MASGESLREPWATSTDYVDNLANQDSPPEFISRVTAVERMLGTIISRVRLWEGYDMVHWEALHKVCICDIVQGHTNQVINDNRRLTNFLEQTVNIIREFIYSFCPIRKI